MRRNLLFLFVAMSTLSLHAEDYTYLTFETIDGAKTSVPATSLTLTISGTTLTVGEQSFTLSNLSKMYFSASNETTGVNTLTLDDWNTVTDIYDLKGQKISKSEMKNGVYIVRTQKGTFKVAVK